MDVPMPEESALPTEPLGAEMITEMPAAVAAPDAPAAPAADGDAPAFSFKDFAQEHGLNKFASLLADAGLAEFIDNCETALTIFAPSDEAFARLGESVPGDTQLLRELLCVHITIGSLRWARQALCLSLICEPSTQPAPGHSTASGAPPPSA